jgi:hypothetical protein
MFMRFPKIETVKPGDTLIADGGFTCLKDGQHCQVKVDADGLYVECTEGRHGLDGQLNEKDEVVGLCTPAGRVNLGK